MQRGVMGLFSIPVANSPSLPCSAVHSGAVKLSAPRRPSPSALCGQVALVGRQPPSAAPDELVAMGTVNGLVSGDFGPDINTQRLILPAGRQREKDTGEGRGGEGGGVTHKGDEL